MSEAQLNNQVADEEGTKMLVAVFVIDIAATRAAWADPLDLYSAQFALTICSQVNGMTPSAAYGNCILEVKYACHAYNKDKLLNAV